MRWGAVLSLVAGGLMSAVCYADADGKKEVTWSFQAKVPPNVITGSWSAWARARAACSHKVDGPHEHAPGANGKGQWNGIAGFAGPVITDKAAVPHAKTTTNVQMSADAAEAVGPPPGNGFTRYQTVLRKQWDTKMDIAPDPSPGSSSRGWLHGESKLSAGSALKWELSGQVEGVAIRPRSGKGDGKGPQAVKTKNGHTAKWADPIHITLINDRTLEELTEELFRLSLDADMADESASWSITDSQFTLVAGGGNSNEWLGSIGMSGSAKSSWLLNPLGDFSVSLGGGLFAASGFWENLWQVQTDAMGRAVAATLNLSQVNFDLQYMIPDSVMNDTDTYTRELSVTEDFDEQIDGVIPTPGTISLLGAGVVVLATAWRKR
jgi:hypothetical protein